MEASLEINKGKMLCIFMSCQHSARHNHKQEFVCSLLANTGICSHSSSFCYNTGPIFTNFNVSPCIFQFNNW